MPVSCGGELERGGQCGGVLELVSVNEDAGWSWQDAPFGEGYVPILECLKCGALSEGVMMAHDLWEESVGGVHA